MSVQNFFDQIFNSVYFICYFKTPVYSEDCDGKKERKENPMQGTKYKPRTIFCTRFCNMKVSSFARHCCSFDSDSYWIWFSYSVLYQTMVNIYDIWLSLIVSHLMGLPCLSTKKLLITTARCRFQNVKFPLITISFLPTGCQSFFEPCKPAPKNHKQLYHLRSFNTSNI